MGVGGLGWRVNSKNKKKLGGGSGWGGVRVDGNGESKLL